MEGDIDGLDVYMNHLVESHKRGQTDGKLQYQDVKARGLRGITCLL